MLTKLPSPEAGSLREWLASEGDASKRHLWAREATVELGALANGSSLVGGRGQSPSAELARQAMYACSTRSPTRPSSIIWPRAIHKVQIGCASAEAGVGFEVDDERESFPADLIERPGGGVTM